MKHLRLQAQGEPLLIPVVLAVGSLRISDHLVRRAGEILEVVLQHRPQRETVGQFFERCICAQGKSEAILGNAVGKAGNVTGNGGCVGGVVVDHVARIVDVVADIQVKPQR